MSRGNLSKCLDKSQSFNSCVPHWRIVAQYLESRAQLSPGSPARHPQGQGLKTGLMSLLAGITGLCMGQESFPLCVQGRESRSPGPRTLLPTSPADGCSSFRFIKP